MLFLHSHTYCTLYFMWGSFDHQQMEHLLKELLTTLCFVQIIKPGLQVNLMTCMIIFTVIEMWP